MELDRFFPIWLNIILAGLAIGFAVACHQTHMTPLITYPAIGFSASLALVGVGRFINSASI